MVDLQPFVLFQIKHKLVDPNKLAKEVKNMPEYSAFFKLQKIKS